MGKLPFNSILYGTVGDKTMTISLETTLRRSGDDILCAPVSTGELVMLSVSAGRYYGLNSVGARIWELLETPMTVAQICARLCEEYNVEAQECETEVLKFANEMVHNGIAHGA
jgi:Coenzyme PQQ synthesis protein D (PqqD)